MSEITDPEFKLACRLHGEALWCHSWLLGPGRDSEAPGADHARRTAERMVHHRGWSIEQVDRYAAMPELALPHKWPLPKTQQERRPGDDFTPAPLHAIRSVLRRLERSRPESPLPTPERARELAGWLYANAKRVGDPHCSYAAIAEDAKTEEQEADAFQSTWGEA